MAGEPHANGSAAAEAQASKKRKRETDDQDNVSACNHPSPPDRASVEPGVRCRPDREAKAGARQGEADSGTQGPYGDADLALDVDLSAALAAESGVAEEAAAAAAAASFLPLDGELEEELPMVVDPSSPSAEPMAAEGPPAAAAATPAATVVEELSLCAPAEAQAAVGLPPAPSKQESALLPQCAIMAGRALEPTEISTHHRVGGEAATAAAAALPLSPRYPSQQYLAVKAELATGIISPRQAGVSWEHFPNHLGEGVRSRLLALATLHLRPGSSAPAAVKELAANSNRVLLGAATNCELYQERVIRALAQKVGTPLLVADMYSLKLDEVLKEEGGAGLDEPFGLVGGFPPDPWEASDEDDPFLGLPKADKKEGGKEASLDTALAMRNKAAARRNVPGIAYLSLSLPGARHPPASMAAATAAAAATEQAAKEVCERADAVAEKVKGAHAKMAVLRSGVPDSHLPAAGIAAAAKPPAAGATTAALCEMQEEVLNATHLLAVAMDKEGKRRQLMEKGEDAPAPATAAATATQQPAASAVASGTGPCEAGEKMATLAALPSVTFPAASAAPAGGGGGGAAPPAAATQQAGTSMAVSKVTPPAVRRGDRISYVGKVHPSLAAAQERLDQLQVAINRVESSSSQRARDYLPQLLVRRTLVAAQSQRMPRMQGSSAPPIGSKGRVVGVTDDKLQVVFDEPFSGGINLAGQKDKCGFSCTPEDLQVIEDKEDPLVSSLQALFDVIAQAADSGPIIAFIQNLDRLLRTHATDHFRKLETLLAALPPRCLLFASYCSRSLARSEAKREGGPPSLSRFFGSLGGDTSFGGGGAGAGTTLGGDDASLLDRFGRGPGRSQRKSTKGKLLSKMLPNHLELHPPNQEAHAKAWKKMVEADVATMRQRSNRTALRKAFARCGCACDEWDAVSITDCQLVRKDIEQIVGMAVAQQLSAEGGGMEQDTAAVPAAAAAVVEGAKVAAKEPAATDEAAPTEDTAAAAAAATLERSGSVAVMVAPAASSAAEVPFPAGAEARDQQQQQVAAVSAPAADQPCTMQTDEAEGGGVAAAAPAKQPNASTATVGAAAAVDPGGTATVEAGEKVVPLWTLRAEHIMVAAEAIRKVQAEAAAQPEKQALRDVAVDQYEKQLLSEIIPPEEISVSFDDIGALDSVKNTLHEVVILPLQRPELFTRGTLAKPTKGLLLFGPPGTGKTMLAKAVASESGAHFINVNMSAITSKWFGEGERLVRALFGLAHKLSPSVIFVDEIDSFLSKRGQSNNEHEALRKMKNEFMTHWDGLRTKQSDRVLVLAATNRPMDLDDAVIRRMPRRIFVPLPDAANRERILQVILKDEDLDPAFDFKEAASVADGYSGSDLKNLCIAAAYCPIREYLEAERAAKAVEKAAAAQAVSGEGGTASSSAGSHARAAAAFAAAASSATPAALVAVATAAVAPEPVQLRKITMADFKDALKQVTASTHSDSATMGELRRWNDQYGEGGTRSKEVLAYFM